MNIQNKILTLLFLCSVCIGINTEYSYKDFTDKSFTTVDSKALGGEIVGSCFYQQAEPNSNPIKEIFPKDLKATFIRCNLDNVKIPAGCTMIDCCNNAIRPVNGADYFINKDTNEPTTPVNPVSETKAPEQQVVTVEQAIEVLKNADLKAIDPKELEALQTKITATTEAANVPK